MKALGNNVILLNMAIYNGNSFQFDQNTSEYIHYTSYLYNTLY